MCFLQKAGFGFWFCLTWKYWKFLICKCMLKQIQQRFMPSLVRSWRPPWHRGTGTTGTTAVHRMEKKPPETLGFRHGSMEPKKLQNRKKRKITCDFFCDIGYTMDTHDDIFFSKVEVFQIWHVHDMFHKSFIACKQSLGAHHDSCIYLHRLSVLKPYAAVASEAGPSGHLWSQHSPWSQKRLTCFIEKIVKLLKIGSASASARKSRPVGGVCNGTTETQLEVMLDSLCIHILFTIYVYIFHELGHLLFRICIK